MIPQSLKTLCCGVVVNLRIDGNGCAFSGEDFIAYGFFSPKAAKLS